MNATKTARRTTTQTIEALYRRDAMSNETKQTTYFVVAAPGHYGDRTRVISSHRSLAAAKRNATAGYVVRAGEKAKGDEFTRASESIYPVAR